MNDRIDRTVHYGNSDLARLDNNQCPPITATELTDVIKAMKHKAPGLNRLTAHQLKNLPDNMTYKEATMTLIPKPGTAGTTIIDKGRISLLNVDGKLFDKILYSRRLTTYLKDYNLQNDRQRLQEKQRD